MIFKGIRKGNQIRRDGGSPLDVYQGAVKEMGGDFTKLLPDFLAGGKERFDSPKVFESVIESRPPENHFKRISKQSEDLKVAVALTTSRDDYKRSLLLLVLIPQMLKTLRLL